MPPAWRDNSPRMAFRHGSAARRQPTLALPRGDDWPRAWAPRSRAAGTFLGTPGVAEHGSCRREGPKFEAWRPAGWGVSDSRKAGHRRHGGGLRRQPRSLVRTFRCQGSEPTAAGGPDSPGPPSMAARSHSRTSRCGLPRRSKRSWTGPSAGVQRTASEPCPILRRSSSARPSRATAQWTDHFTPRRSEPFRGPGGSGYLVLSRARSAASPTATSWRPVAWDAKPRCRLVRRGLATSRPDGSTAESLATCPDVAE